MGKQQPIEIFMPPNILRAKAGRTSRDDELVAVMRAEAAVDALKAEFIARLGTDIDRLEIRRDQFALSPDQSGRAELLRMAHDLKDQATTFDFPLIARLAATLVGLFENSAEESAASLALIDAQVNAIRAALNDRMGTREAEASGKTS